MITAISNFKQNCSNGHLKPKSTKVNVTFSSNFDAEFRALKTEARALGIQGFDNQESFEAFKELRERVRSIKNPTFWDKVFKAIDDFAARRDPGAHHY